MSHWLEPLSGPCHIGLPIGQAAWRMAAGFHQDEQAEKQQIMDKTEISLFVNSSQK